MTLTEVTRVLELLGEGIVTEQRAIDGIKARGVAFVATAANVTLLRSKNPPATVLSTILSLATPAPVAPPPPSGKDVVIHCAPAECDISINGQERGLTQGGKLLLPRQRFGRMVVQAKKDGYVGGEIIVVLNAETQPDPTFQLAPAYETKREFGKNLTAEMLKRLGMGANAKCDITGQGAASIWSEDGKLSEYNVLTAFGPPALAEFEVTDDQGSFALQCRGTELCRQKPGNRYRLNGPKKKLPPEKIQQITTNLRLLRRYHLCTVLDQILAPGTTPLANDAASQEVQFVSGDGTYVLTLGDDRLPGTIVYQSKSGLGSGLTFTYGDFVSAGPIKYPRRTAIRLPGAEKGGIQVRLQTLKEGAALKENDFPR